jgi:hypothetical protein
MPRSPREAPQLAQVRWPLVLMTDEPHFSAYLDIDLDAEAVRR